MTEDVIPKGPDRKREKEILTLLYDVDQETNIDWQRLIDIAQECNEIFQRWGTTRLHRQTGRKGKLTRGAKEWTSEELLMKHIEEDKKTWENSLDPFYNPACCYIADNDTGNYIRDDEGNLKRYYPNDWDASEALKIILSPDFKLPDEIFTDELFPDEIFPSVIHINPQLCIFGIKKAFFLMSQQDNPPMKTALRLAELLMEIYSRALVLREQVIREEKAHDEGAGTRRKATTKKLNDIKQNRLYSDLVKIMDTYEDTRKKNQEMDVIISKAIKKNNEKTLRRYRRLILDEYNKQKQQ